MASKNTIGSRIVIEGEKEYNASLKRIKAEQAELRSEMKLCTESYKENENTIEALTKKHELLTKQIETQEKAVEAQKKMLTNASKAQEDAKKQTENYKTALVSAEKELQKMEQTADTSTEVLEAQKKEIQDLNNKLVLSQQGYDKAEAAVTRYQTSLNNSQANLQGLKNELSKTNTYMSEAKQSVDGCAESIDKYGKAVNKAEEKSEEFGEAATASINALAGALVATGIAKGIGEITDALIDCSEVAKVFETNMAKVYTIADEAVVSQNEMAAQILGQSTALVQSSSDMAEAAYNAISAGVDTANAVDFAATSTKLAVGGFTNAATAVDILTTAVNAYGLEVSEATEISDMLITTQNLGKTEVNDLAANMGKVIPLAAAYNMKMSQLSSTYAILTANGIKTAESTTYIKAMLNELGDSGSSVSEILVNSTGKSFSQLMEDGYSLGEVLKILGDDVNGDTGAFNELWSSSEAGIGALSLLGSGVDEFNNVLSQMENSTGATQAAFEKMTDTTEYAEKKMKIAIENLKIAIGQELNPELKNMYDTGANAFDWATKFIQEHPEAVKAITVIVTALGTAAIAVGGLTVAIAALNAVLTIASPVTALLMAAIAGLAGAVGTLIVTQEKEQTLQEAKIAADKEEIKNIREKVASIKEEMDQENTRLSKIKTLITDISNLNNMYGLSVAEQQEMVDKVAILNQEMPELNLSIDEQTGKLNELTSAFEARARVMVAQEEENAIQEESIKLLEAKTEATDAFTRKQQEYDEGLQKIADLEKRHAELLAQEEEEWATLGFTRIETSEALGEVEIKLYDAQDAQARLTQELRDSESVMSEASEEYNNYAEGIDSLKNATEGVNTVQIEYKGTTHDVTTAVAADMQTLQAAYDEAQTAAEESLKTQVGLFEELSTKSDLTTGKMADNLDSQTQAFTQYKDDMLAASELVEEGLMDEGLLGSLQSLGMDGAGYLHELVTASKEDASAYAEVITKYKEMVEARTELSETIGDLQTDYSNSMDELLGVQTEKYGELVTNTEGTYDEIQLALEEALAKMVTTQETGIGDMVTCVADNYDDIKGATEGLTDAAIKGITDTLVIADDGSSEVFTALGRKIPESMAEGIRAGQDLVSGAVQEVINNAIDNADMSVISGAIDRKLGQAFQ